MAEVFISFVTREYVNKNRGFYKEALKAGDVT